MLKHLQKSVEEEELVWKSKMGDSEEQLRLVSYNLSWHVFASLPCFEKTLTIKSATFCQALEKVSKLEAENQSIEQVGPFPH